MWDLPGSGIKPMSLALAGRFFTTEVPVKPFSEILKQLLWLTFGSVCLSIHSGFGWPSVHPSFYWFIRPWWIEASICVSVRLSIHRWGRPGMSHAWHEVRCVQCGGPSSWGSYVCAESGPGFPPRCSLASTGPESDQGRHRRGSLVWGFGVLRVVPVWSGQDGKLIVHSGFVCKKKKS